MFLVLVVWWDGMDNLMQLIQIIIINWCALNINVNQVHLWLQHNVSQSPQLQPLEIHQLFILLLHVQLITIVIKLLLQWQLLALNVLELQQQLLHICQLPLKPVYVFLHISIYNKLVSLQLCLIVSLNIVHQIIKVQQ